MTTSTTSSEPGSPGSREPRHRAEGRGEGPAAPARPAGVPAPRGAGGRHRAPDAPPSGGSTIVPGPRDAEAGERARPEAGPASGFRPLPPGAPAPRPASSVGVPLGAVPSQRGTGPREAAVPRCRPAHGEPEVLDDEAVTVPVGREALDRAVASGIHDPASREAVEVRSARAVGVASRPAVARPDVPRRGVAPWETPPVDRPSARAGLVAVAVGALGALLGLAPWSGVLPRVLPASALGATPVFDLAGALLGVVALGLGAVAMFRAGGMTRGFLAGVLGAGVGTAAIIVGLVV